MNYSNRRLFIVSFFLLSLFLAFFWVMQNSTFINTVQKDVLLYMNSSWQGFNSQRAYAVYYNLFFLLFMNIGLRKEEPSFVVLHKSRTDFYIRRSLSILISAFWFTFSISIINTLLTFIFIEHSLLMKESFYLITFLNGLTVFFFFSGIGLLEKVIEDKIRSYVLGVIITFILISSTYFLGDYLPWLPIKDIRLYEGFLTGTWTFYDALLVYLKQIGLVGAISILGHIIFKEKDFIFYEK
ncbi:WxPxxD family membrane protein [Priestia aryabhattai]|uniref:WxPxxD family membrane protein n=1 Tax=Priestia aryabhattai TaxID=412384 RepID=UPI001ADACF0D|nr:WxPxxD family membrane protein [Priestia aryabhattai]QTL52611.1 WxPxxD family membrane protein [Priestia aryabhattai]